MGVNFAGPPWLWVPCVLSYIILSCYAFCICYQFCNRTKAGATWSAVVKFFRHLCARGDNGKDQYSLDSKVRALVMRERVRSVRSCARPALHYFAFAILCNLLVPHSAHCDVLNSADLLQSLCNFILCAVFVAAPRLVTPRTIDFSYVFFTAWCICRMLLLVELAHTDLTVAVFNLSVTRAIFGIIAGNARVTGACNTLVMVANISVLFARPHRLLMPELVSHVIVQEALTTVLIILLFFASEHWMWSASRRALEIKASSQAEVTVRRLLSALCDAVVTLGPDLRMSAPAPKLANLLGCSSRALQGTLFPDFMAETDQDRFRDFLDRVPDNDESGIDPEPAQALNVHLREGMGGTAVQVQLFYSHFHDLNAQVVHLIGICEDSGSHQVGARMEAHTDETAVQTNQALLSSAMPTASARTCDSVSTRQGTCSNIDSISENIGDSVSDIYCLSPAAGLNGFGVAGGSPAHARSGDSVPPLRGPEDSRWRQQAQHREVSLVFDALRFSVEDRQHAAPVLDASLLEKESLQQWVAEWGTCRAWMQDFVNAVLCPVTASSWPSRAGAPASLSFQVAFRGSCPLPPDLLSRSALPPPTPEAGPDSLVRGGRTAGVPSISEETPSLGHGTSDPGTGTKPPTKLTVSRVRVARRTRSSSHGTSSLPSESGRRRHHRQRVQPSVLGAASVDRGDMSGSSSMVSGKRRLPSHETPSTRPPEAASPRADIAFRTKQCVQL